MEDSRLLNKNIHRAISQPVMLGDPATEFMGGAKWEHAEDDRIDAKGI
jgi:hypothetical protein